MGGIMGGGGGVGPGGPGMNQGPASGLARVTNRG
jgi:hypothetical protein